MKIGLKTGVSRGSYLNFRGFLSLLTTNIYGLSLCASHLSISLAKASNMINSDSSGKHSFSPIAGAYTSVPDGLQLQNLIIIHRHGDRAQISRSLGENFPEDSTITNIWKEKLPDEELIKGLRQISNIKY